MTEHEKEVRRVARQCVRDASNACGAGWHLLGRTLQWGLVAENILAVGMAQVSGDDAAIWQFTRDLYREAQRIHDLDWEVGT